MLRTCGGCILTAVTRDDFDRGDRGVASAAVARFPEWLPDGPRDGRLGAVLHGPGLGFGLKAGSALLHGFDGG